MLLPYARATFPTLPLPQGLRHCVHQAQLQHPFPTCNHTPPAHGFSRVTRTPPTHLTHTPSSTCPQGLWHYVHQVDAQLQQLRATQQYLYWRERRHRATVESTNSRVLWFALLRAAVLVCVSIGQVLFIRRMFSKSAL